MVRTQRGHDNRLIQNKGLRKTFRDLDLEDKKGGLALRRPYALPENHVLGLLWLH